VGSADIGGGAVPSGGASNVGASADMGTDMGTGGAAMGGAGGGAGAIGSDAGGDVVTGSSGASGNVATAPVTNVDAGATSTATGGATVTGGGTSVPGATGTSDIGTSTPTGARGISGGAAPQPLDASGGRGLAGKGDVSGAVATPSGFAPGTDGPRLQPDSGAAQNPAGIMGDGRGVETSSAVSDPNQFSRGSSISGSTGTSNVTGSASMNVDASGTRDLESSTYDAQHAADPSHVDAGMNQTLGADGRAAISGGTGEQHVMAGAREADAQMHVERNVDVEGRAQTEATNSARSGVQDEIGLNDPNAAAGRAQSAGYKASGQVQAGQTTVASGQAVVADPTGSAKSAAADAGMREVNERAPLTPADAQAKVNVASPTVRDPATAGEARVDVEVDAKVRGIDPTKK
jgi:hypothetical protein